MFRKNFYSFVPDMTFTGGTDLVCNGNKMGAYWPDRCGWASTHPTCKGGLIFFFVGDFSGFAYNQAGAERVMLVLAKAEVERVRKSRKRK